MSVVLLAVGGVLGALSRYHGARLVQARLQGNFPLGTFLINVSGSFALGTLLGAVAAHPGWPATALTLLFGAGFCGAYTTFSSFAFETIQLWRQGDPRRAVLNLLAQPLLGGLAALIGMLLGARAM